MSGLRYARHSRPMRSLIIRNLSFCVCASCLWALLPVIARDQLHLGAGGYGLLSASFGIGAVVGALSIPRQLQSRTLNAVVTSGVLLWMAATLLIAATDITAIALAGAFGAGVAWVCVLASLSAGTQSTAPAWVRARAVAMNLVAVQASLALGSVLWGTLASAAGTRVALATSATVMFVLHVLNRRVSVAMGNEADVTPAVQLPDLAIAVEPLPDDGPVLIQIEYQIDPEHARGIPARDPRGRADAAAQRRDELARVPRRRRGRPLCRALHHHFLGRIRPAAHADDDGRPQAAGPRAELQRAGRADSRVATDRRHRAGTVAVLRVMPFAVAPGAHLV